MKELMVKELLNTVLNAGELGINTILVNGEINVIFNKIRDVLVEKNLKDGEKYSLMMYRNTESLQNIQEKSVVLIDFKNLTPDEVQILYTLTAQERKVPGSIIIIKTDDVEHFDGVFLRRVFNVNLPKKVTVPPLLSAAEQILKSPLSKSEKEILFNSMFIEQAKAEALLQLG